MVQGADMTRYPAFNRDVGDPVAFLVTASRRQALAQVLPLHIDMLAQRRAGEVPPGDVEGYLALGWMRWAAGRIVITPIGMRIRDGVVSAP
jgi:hypothetical protein